ncbi:hypothetical protein KVT40_003797 [Elsinoe batatas]|uniref:Gem-associated protein 5 TPR domain-containing protein n=1 Tax=Elsinoe batatas TaxID=2601811 RepID=A0A8K0L3R3_9PEZI|nr:hypothetical protein KVT40_003797 [Elsinoe batatas]
MSTGLTRRQSQSSKKSGASIHPAPAPTLTPENAEQGLQASATTGELLLVGQGNQVLVLRHGTLAIERRFEKHREDVVWLAVDNISERGNGRLAVSYDTGNTAIIWDIQTGDEITRFAAYEPIKVAAWMRNGNVVFGNSSGNIILFDPATSEHISTRTIFDPITAIAPYVDCRTYAVGYMNGSIMIISIHPTFTIHYTLTTQRRPSPVATVAWHSGAGRHKTDMLATQTADGDMRVWNVPRADGKAHQCLAIRIMSLDEGIVSGPNWFGWSRNGRIIQHSDRRTRLHDMRTKQVVVQPLNVPEGLTSICNFGATSAMFTVHNNSVIQQWDVNPEGDAFMVKSVQHIPANVPPSPPGSIDESKGTTLPPVLPTFSESEASESEKSTMSPLQRIAREMDELEEERERRDRLAPLSPGSSRSSTSSKSSGRRLPNYLYDKPSSRTSNGSRDSTEFSMSMAQSQPRNRESASVRSSTSYRSSLLRKEVMRSPDDPTPTEILDLFPVTRARLHDVVFRAPDYGEGIRTPDLLRKEMLRIVFGWSEDIRPLIRDEMMRHSPGSSRAVLLAKWLGELGSDSMISMMGSNSMSSSDWMLLALGSIGKDSQKKVGEAFVQRLLEKGDIHPAVAILLGLGEFDDAIEAYVSQRCFMEALLLTCLTMPANWERQCFLLRKWGEVAVKTGSPELAVRIFSCTSEETTGPWFSPRAQDAVYTAQKEQVLGPASMSPPGSPPSAGPSARFNAKNASLKLITTFGTKGVPVLTKVDDITPMNSVGADGVTPIAMSALSPGGQNTWLRENRRERDPASARSARTATPGAFGRKRLPSRDQTLRTPQETPQTASRDFAISTITDDGPATVLKSHRRVSSLGGEALPETLSPAKYQPGERKVSDPSYLPSPAVGVFNRLKEEGHARNGSRHRMPDGLEVKVYQTFAEGTTSPALSTHATSRSGISMSSSLTGRSRATSPPLTANSATSSVKGRARDPYMNSVEQARITARATRERSKARAESKSRRRKDRSESRGRHDVRYIRPAKRSPSSPVPMSPDEVLAATQAAAATREAAERVTSPIERPQTRDRSRRPGRERSRARSPEKLAVGRGRSDQRHDGSMARSPSSPLPKSPEMTDKKDGATDSDGQRVRLRSSSRKPLPRATSTTRDAELYRAIREDSGLGLPSATEAKSILSRKELAAKELEERRLSLVRRPSAPAIPMPSDLNRRPQMAPRYHTELGESPTSFAPPYSGNPSRSQSVDAESMGRPLPRASGPPNLAIGLPATPKAMMHPRYMAESRESIPEVPPIPTIHDSPQEDQLGPLLPSTTYSQPAPEPRSASAPIERNDIHPAYRNAKTPNPSSASGLRRNSLRTHARSQTHDGPMIPAPHQRSPSIVTASIDETLASDPVVVKTVDLDPPLLPELQHLAGPPPPPPIPMPPSLSQEDIRHSAHEGYSSAGTIDISLDPSTSPSQTRPQLPDQRASTASPTQQHRRGRNSISDSKSFGNRIRNVTERMRSTSRSNNKSPTISGPMNAVGTTIAQSSPYETVLPLFPTHTAPGPTGSLGRSHARRESLSSLRTTGAKSPYETTVCNYSATNTPLHEHPSVHLPSRPGTSLSRPGTAPLEQASGSRSASAMGGTMATGYFDSTTVGESQQRKGSTPGLPSGYVRHPKEIRANMPPEMLQQGVYVPPAGWGREREGSVGPSVGGRGREGSVGPNIGGRTRKGSVSLNAGVGEGKEGREREEGGMI